MVSADIWSRYLESLKKRISEQYFPYIEGMTCRNMSETRWDVCVPDKSSLSIVETRLTALLEDVLHDVLRSQGLNDDVKISFSLSGVSDKSSAMPERSSGVLPLSGASMSVCDVSTVEAHKAAFQIGQTAFGSSSTHVEDSSDMEPFVTSEEVRIKSKLKQKFSFDNFVMGGSNQEALSAAKAVAGSPGSAFNPLFIYGGAGLGKTHLMQAIGNEILDTTRLRVRYITSEEFVNQCMNAMSGIRQMEVFRQSMRDNIDVLLLDDVQFIAGKDRTQMEFFNTFNDLIANGKQIVLTSDRDPHDISDIDERMRSRFCSNGWFDIQLPDFETRLAILRKKSRAEGIILPDDVAQYMASKVATNVRELEGCLKRIIGSSQAHHESFTFALAQLVIEPFYQTRQILLNVEAIVSCVCTYFGISHEEIMGRSRKKELSYPRKIAMYLARTHTSLSLPDLGRAFGGRDHTTVLSAVQAIVNDLKTDNELQLNIKTIEKKLFEKR